MKTFFIRFLAGIGILLMVLLFSFALVLPAIERWFLQLHLHRKWLLNWPPVAVAGR